ncbi:hypothetical protein [uncultured Gilliamella sp.]|uniref:hypothetical protein n=1 Tax=uncultured Gilliamella sp. TaxID=1193505 RepID=UPI0025CC30F6|nr:hypothetical protein [uncultured Gilliamella sp.]
MAWWYWVAKGTADTANYLADFVDYKTQRGLLKAQAKMYQMNAKNTLWEGQQNADKISREGEQAQGTVIQDFGASGVDVNDSQTVASSQRTLQKNINDDVFATMYSAAKEANQQTINAKMAKYNAKQLKKGFIFRSIGTWANNAAKAMSASSMMGGGGGGN